MMNRTITFIVVTSVLSAAVFCRASGGTEAGKIRVFAGISPVARFVDRIGGPYVETSILVPPGRDMHTFEPTPRTMADLAKARLFFTIGLPFERTFTRKASSTFRNLEIIDAGSGIKRRMMSESEFGSHEHAHGKGEADPHIWLDPVRARKIAANICTGLVRVDPARRETYERNLAALQKDLDRLNGRIGRKLAPFRGKEIFVFHPAFGYFTDRYGLRQVSVERGGKQPTAAQLARLVDRAEKAGVKVIFVQPEFSERSAQAAARAIRGTAARIDPLAYEYIRNLDHMADKIAGALSKTGDRRDP
jgi:zinc transport system substrate-binding protein